jgi:ABC-type dipeptide/oligopeptide/nickel transport system permease component
LRRLIGGLAVLWAAATLAFLGGFLVPGDPAAALIAPGAPPQEVEARRQALGLDRPVPVQYVGFLAGLLRGDLGRSWFSGQSVSAALGEAFAPTLTLALAAMAVAVGVGVGVGVIGAMGRRTWIEGLSLLLATLSLSAPVYWTGTLAIAFFSVRLGWLPATGSGGLSYLLLPALVLGLASAGAIARLVHAQLLAALQSSYIVTAQAKGLPRYLIVLRHALRNALIPVVTVVGLQFGFLLGGAVLTERVFARPGLGRLVVQAILQQDLPVVRGAVILGAVLYTLVNLLTDLSYTWLDPRLRASGEFHGR